MAGKGVRTIFRQGHSLKSLRRGDRCGGRKIVLTPFFLVLAAGASAWAAEAPGIKVSQGGVDVFVPRERFRGEMSLLEKGDWETLLPERLPRATSAPPVLASASLVAAIDGQKSVVSLYGRQGNRLTKRGDVSWDGGGRVAHCQLVRSKDGARLGAEIRSTDNRVLATLYLSPDGVLEFQPGEEKDVTLSSARLSYAIVPSLIGTDFVYTARTAAGHPAASNRCYLPSMNLLVGLVEGDDSMLVGVWPPGQQVASLRTASEGSRKVIDGFSLQTAGRSFYLALLERPHIWHSEPLLPDYLERDTEIGWRRPFEAKWIGRFYVASEEINYPFYFRDARVELWGRPVRSWFWWPVWFDRERTMIHFEKRFPPKGDLLIYHLEKHPERPAGTAILSPVEVLQQALGPQEAAGLLDLAGIDERPVVSHGLCVCEMTSRLQRLFDAGEEVRERAQIARYAEDIGTFITNVRVRLFEFREFAAQTRQFLKARAAAEPKVADAAGRLLGLVEEIEGVYQGAMPHASLGEVRQWTAEFNTLAREVRPGNDKKFDAAAEKCRSVSGAQDDLVRDLSVLVLRLAEKAAQEAGQSPEHAAFAREVISRTRQILRNPTPLEVRRHHRLAPDPGRPTEDDEEMLE